MATIVSPINTTQGVSTPVKDPLSVAQNLTLAAQNKLKSYTQDPFWPKVDVDPAKWDKYCPYQLIVVEATEDQGKVSYKPFQDWKYTLPLPPDSISISTPFAIQLTPTLGGFIEEHNGAPLRTIQIRGTTGFLPLRASNTDKASSPALGQIESIFGGTANVIGNVNQSLQNTVNAALNVGPQAFNVYAEAEFTADATDKSLVMTSGFVQISLLRHFLESYAAIKKTPQGFNLRLAVAIWKEDQVYLVTPMNFVVTKSKESPMEYVYDLSFKAWKRIILESGNYVKVQPTAIRRDPNLIARAINTLTFARKTLYNIGALKQGLLGDVDYVFRPLHDTILLGKDLLGTALTLAEIPLAIKQRVAINLSELQYESQDLWNQITSSQTYDKAGKALKYAFADKSTHMQDMPVGYRHSSVLEQQGKGRATQAKNTLKLVDIPIELAEQIPIQNLKLDQSILNDIRRDLNRVRNLTRKDFELYLATMQKVVDKLTALLGAGDPVYSDTYGVDVASTHETTLSDWNTIMALQDSIETLQEFAATADGGPDDTATLLERYGDLATASGVAWTQPVSKYSVPYPYGFSLEQLAFRYLGNPDRWMEIAALNGLQAPYIDETGYQLGLLSNPIGDTLIVNFTEDLFVGKIVWIGSSVLPKVKCLVQGLQRIGDTLSVRLDQDVSYYKATDSAFLEGFLTGTVNSRNQIWIPSEREPLDDDDVITKDIPNIDTTDPMTGVGGVDILLTSENDLVLENGDITLVSGLTNIVQWVRILLGLQKLELLQHPNMGLGVEVGMSLADFDPQQTVKGIREMLQTDPTFSNIDKIKVTQKGPGCTIDIGATVTGTTQPLPLSYGMRLG